MTTPEFDSLEWREARNLQLLGWLQGNKDALDFLLTLFNIAEVWDDIIDGDTPDQGEINQAFMDAIFGLNGNRFYRQHADYLQPLMMAGINAWLDSTELEKETDTWSQTWAYALRDWYMELVAACAYIVGGFNHMRRISLEARRFFQAETLEEFAAGKLPPPTVLAPKTRVWLENAKGQRLEDVTIEPAVGGTVTARFRSTAPFDLAGATVVMEVEGLGKSRTPLTKVTCRTLHTTDEFIASWSIN